MLPLQELIGRSEEAAVSLARIVAYPVGFEVTLDAFTRAMKLGVEAELIRGAAQRAVEIWPASS